MRYIISVFACCLLLIALTYRAIYPLHLTWYQNLAIWTAVTLFLFIRFCYVLFQGDN